MAEHYSARQTNGEANPPGLGAANGRISSDAPFEPEAPEGAKKKKPTGLLILLLVVGLAIGGMVAMRALMGPRTSTGPDRIPDPDASSKKADEIMREIDVAVRDLKADYTKGQVKTVPDPFKGEPPPPPPPPPPDTRFERAAERLRLTALMRGSTPMAVINDRPRNVGDLVKVDLMDGTDPVAFRVMRIALESATVEGEGANPRFEKVMTLDRGR